MVRFLGLDYWKKVEEIANGDEEFEIKARTFVASFTFNVTEGSDVPAIYVKFDNGKVAEVRELAEGEKTDFTLEGPYSIWTQVNKGEIMSEIIRYSKAFLRLFQVMEQVPVEY